MSLYLLVCGTFGILAAGTVLITISMATPNWMESDILDEQYGLFKACIRKTCGSLQLNTYSTVGSRMKTAQVLACIGVVCAYIAFIIGHVFIQYAAKDRVVKKSLLYASFALSLLAAIFTIVNCIVYKVNVFDFVAEQDLRIGFSFYLAAVGGALVFLGGIVTLAAGLRIKPSQWPQPGGNANAVGYIAREGQSQVYVNDALQH